MVYDTFMDSGLGEKPTHQCNTFKDRGEIVGAYATAKTKAGDYLTQCLDLDQINSIRDRSESYKKYKSGTWVTDFEEMAKKSAIRNLFKTLPRTDERRMSILAEAVHMSNENEGFEPLISSPSVGQPTADQKNYFDSFIERGEALEMYCFAESFGHDASSPSAAIWTSLYHSFPKGEKGKYQRIVDDLRRKGGEQFSDLLSGLEAAIHCQDDVGIGEIVEGLSGDAQLLLASRLTPEASHYFQNDFKRED